MPRSSTSGQGRPKGTPNRLTADVRAMILAALDKVGGVDYLVAQAERNPSAFLTLVGKVLPLQMTGTNDGPVMIVTGVPRLEDQGESDRHLLAE
jgi:hypothetical protein